MRGMIAVVVLAGLVAPALVLPAFAGPAPSPPAAENPTPPAPSSFYRQDAPGPWRAPAASEGLLLDVDSSSTSRGVALTLAGSSSEETDPDERRLAVRFMISSDAARDAPVFRARASTGEATPALDEGETDSAVWSVMATAQGTLAALGAAAQTEPAGARSLLPGSESMTDAGSVSSSDAPGVWQPPSWFLAVFWTVFLASLGILLVPRTLAAGSWGLYARLTRHEMEDHPHRAALMECVRDEPGIHIARLAERTGIAEGTVRHHLDQLVRHGLVRRVPQGRATHHYASGPIEPAPAAVSGPRRRLVALLRHEPGLTTPELAKRLAVRVQTVWEHLQRLKQAGLVDDAKAGRASRWRCTSA